MTNRHLPTTAIAAIACVLTAACADTSPTIPSSQLASPAASADRQQPTFAIDTFSVPGALGTSPQGINAAGDIVGIYVDASKHTRGFLLHEGTFTTIDYRDPATGLVADNTDARGIGPAGDIVGAHWNDDEEPVVAAHGYHRTPDGAFTPVHFPGHLYEFPQRILPDGTILGCRHDHDLMASMRGIMIRGEQATEAANIFASMSNGATPDGHIVVGLYTNMMMPAHSEAFLIQDGDTTAFMVPGSSQTSAWDINPRGDIVGVFRDGSGFHGFVRTGTGRTLLDPAYTQIDVPGATASRAFGVNERGDVVGAYVAGGKTHGFHATRLR